MNIILDRPDWALMLPQLIVFILAVVLVFADAFLPKKIHFETMTALSLLGYGAALIAVIWRRDEIGQTFRGSFLADGLTVFLSITILVAALLSIGISAEYIRDIGGRRAPIGEYYVLLAFAVVGSMLVAASGDLISLFVGIELAALATYVLTAYTKHRTSSVEGALKYFLLGVFASAILLFGMAWTFGLTGVTNLNQIRTEIDLAVQGQEFPEASVLLALLLLVAGLGFKIAAVPFHMWTPDAYEGAPTPISGYMSVIPKIAGFAAMIRIFVEGLNPLSDDWTAILAVLALLTMALGNIVALSQRNMKRMLAYSSIAHTGYMLVGLAAYQELTDRSGTDGVTALLYYLLAYAFMNIGAFGVLTWVQARGRGEMLDDLSGLASTNLPAAIAMAVFMVSLMGVPPLLGFYAKYYTIVAAMDANLLWLALAIVILSGVSAYFYLRVVAVMFFDTTGKPLLQKRTPILNITIAIMVVANLGLGLFSQSLIDLAEDWSQVLEVAGRATGLH